MKNSILHIFLLVLMVFSESLYGQDNSLLLNGEIVYGNLPYKGVMVYLKDFESKNQIQHVFSDAKGKFKLSLELNKTYELEFSKPLMVTKRIKIDTKVLLEENEHWPIYVKVKMIPFQKNTDYTPYEDYESLLRYFPEKNRFDYDFGYSEIWSNEHSESLSIIDRVTKMLQENESSMTLPELKASENERSADYLKYQEKLAEKDIAKKNNLPPIDKDKKNTQTKEENTIPPADKPSLQDSQEIEFIKSHKIAEARASQERALMEEKAKSALNHEEKAQWEQKIIANEKRTIAIQKAKIMRSEMQYAADGETFKETSNMADFSYQKRIFLEEIGEVKRNLKQKKRNYNILEE